MYKNKKLKAKNYIKKNNLFLFIFNNYNLNNLITFNLLLKNKNLNILHGSKNTVKKLFDHSLYINFKALNNQISTLIGFQFHLLICKTDLNQFLLQLLAFKLNKKIYNKKKLKYLYSFSYKNNKLLFFKFNTAILKIKSK